MKSIRTSQNLMSLPSFAANGNLTAVIEIPAGTNTKFEYRSQFLEFQQDMRDGQPRKVDFLPYPVNYGFIPSTLMEKARGGDGDPLDVIVICEHLPTGTVLEVLPIGLLLLKDGGEWDNKVLAVPAAEHLRTIKALNFNQFQMNYSAARHMIEQFFLNYDGMGVMTLHGWQDEQAAIEEVEKWHIR